MTNVNLYGTANVKATPSGVPISKYYPNVSTGNVVWDSEMVLTTDIGSYQKGTKLSEEKTTNILTALLQSAQSSSTTIKQLEDTIAEQQRVIDYLREIIERGGGGTWPDIANVDGGDSNDPGDNGGDDEIHLPPVPPLE